MGEVKTRASPKTIEEVDRDIEALCNKYPQYLRKKIIKAIYAMQVLPEAIKEAEKRKIWLVTGTKELISWILFSFKDKLEHIVDRFPFSLNEIIVMLVSINDF